MRHDTWFDTVTVDGVDADAVLAAARAVGIDLRRVDDQAVGLTFDETSTLDLVETVLLGVRRNARPRPRRRLPRRPAR